MLDVLLSHSYFYRFDPKQWKNKTPYPPLGTIYAASYLRQHGYTIDLFDTNLASTPKLVEEHIKNHKPKLFVIYDDGFNYLTKMCLTSMREAAFEMISIAKKYNCKVIVNSSDSTDHYKKYLDASADFIIKGEGEITLKELTDALFNNSEIENIQGIIYKNNNEYLDTGSRPVLKDLDQLPLPAWDLVDIDNYKEVWKKGKHEFTLNMATTRGCPFKCNWCAKPIYGNRYNSHSPEYIVNHIKYINEHFQVTNFWFCDDIFGLKPNWVQEFNTLLKKENLSIKYKIQSRVDLLLIEDTIDVLSESGLHEVWVGAESGSQSILDAMDKGITIEQIEKATTLLKSKKVNVAFFIQFGYLGETKEDIHKTLNMIKRLLPDDIGVSVSYPLPGTKFYEKVKEDLKLKANWTDSDDLEMMFKGTFNSKFYKKLHRFVHKEYRKSLALNHLKKLGENPFKLKKKELRLIALLAYYVPGSFLDKIQLNTMELSNA